jgi:hypothetical protein
MEKTDFPRRTMINDSSNLSAACYDPKTKEMVVKFKHSGQWYIYYSVDASMYSMLVGAESVGKAFDRMFRRNDAVPYDKVVD